MGECIIVRRGGGESGGFLAQYSAGMSTFTTYGRPTLVNDTWFTIATIPTNGMKKFVGILALAYVDVPSVFVLTKMDEEFSINPAPARPQLGLGIVSARLHADGSNIMLQVKQAGGSGTDYPYCMYCWATGI